MAEKLTTNANPSEIIDLICGCSKKLYLNLSQGTRDIWRAKEVLEVAVKPTTSVLVKLNFEEELRRFIRNGKNCLEDCIPTAQFGSHAKQLELTNEGLKQYLKLLYSYYEMCGSAFEPFQMMIYSKSDGADTGADVEQFQLSGLFGKFLDTTLGEELQLKMEKGILCNSIDISSPSLTAAATCIKEMKKYTKQLLESKNSLENLDRLSFLGANMQELFEHLKLLVDANGPYNGLHMEQDSPSFSIELTLGQKRLVFQDKIDPPICHTITAKPINNSPSSTTSPIIDSLVQRSGLTNTDIDREVSDDQILKLYLDLTNWKLVARHLGLRPSDIEAIQRDAWSVNLRRLYALKKWKTMGLLTGTATYRVLLDALLVCNSEHLAVKVCKLLKNSQ